MAIIQTVNFYSFSDAFTSSQYKDNFTRDGLRLIFDYLENLSDDTGENIELDVCAICCDYSEDDWEAISENYSIFDEEDEDEDEDEKKERVKEYLEKHTYVVGETDNGFVYQVF